MSRHQLAEDECDRCGAPILWATNSTSGRPLPLDREPSSRGQFTLERQRMVCARLDLPMIEQAIREERLLYSNHMGTCEKRKEERNAA
jgi:hypothetical protein